MGKERDYDQDIFFGPSYRGERQRYLQEAIQFLNDIEAVSRKVDKQPGLTPESLDVLVNYDDGNVIMTVRDEFCIEGVRIGNNKTTYDLCKVELKHQGIRFTIGKTQETPSVSLQFPITYTLNFNPDEEYHP